MGKPTKPWYWGVSREPYGSPARACDAARRHLLRCLCAGWRPGLARKGWPTFARGS